MITEISIHTIQDYGFGKNDTKIIPNINRVNILIGPNNSGKSFFIRSLFQSEDIHYNMDILPELKNLNLAIREFRIAVEKAGMNSIPTHIRNSIESISEIPFINKDIYATFKKIQNSIHIIQSDTVS